MRGVRLARKCMEADTHVVHIHEFLLQIRQLNGVKARVKIVGGEELLVKLVRIRMAVLLSDEVAVNLDLGRPSVSSVDNLVLRMTRGRASPSVSTRRRRLAGTTSRVEWRHQLCRTIAKRDMHQHPRCAPITPASTKDDDHRT